ncbi:MAG: ATP-binding protein [Candidatus Omnitrophota bacterium]
MNKKDIFKKIINEFKDMAFPLIKRDLNLPLDLGKVMTIYGPRRAGKTYLFYQTIQELLHKKISIDNIVYINFEDERILPFAKDDWETLLDAYFELYPDNIHKQSYFFLDEIQEIDLWEKFVRRLSEKRNFSIFLTGSSSKLLSREISTSLRGRALNYFLMPLSFLEFLKFKHISLSANIEHSSNRHKIKKLFDEFLKFGGFPEVIEKEEIFKTQILQGYFDLTFYKDIAERFKIRNFIVMKELMHYLLANFSALFSLNGYFNFLKSKGNKVGKDTIFEYIGYLEEVNFVRLIPLFNSSIKKQMVNPKKAYIIDTGLITALSFQFSENKGKYLENVVFLELLRRGRKVYYFKDDKGREVDFLIVDKNRPEQLIQVCYDLESSEAKNREVNSLVSAAKKFDIKNPLILTNDTKEEIVSNGMKIQILPVWHWLLNS